uniref:Uncharacterized protein n=1 Tax=Accipiter nisus TaxID=211598 RepID=A0A8B9N8X4_9AVES
MRVVGAGCCPYRQTRASQGPCQDRGEATRSHSQHSSGFSSELSPQSSSPSHFQARGLHSVLLHWNSSRGHVRTFSSSVPSMQSASASQRQRMGMQCPFLHWNWAEGLPGQQLGGAWADRHTSSGTGDRVGCQQSRGNYQRGARLIPPPSPLPIPLQGSQLPAGKWVFRGYYGHTDLLLAASRLHVSPKTFSTEGSH